MATPPADPTPPYGSTGRRSRAGLRLAQGLGLVLLVLALLWGLSPWVAPPVARHYLPDGWTLEDAEISRPGLTGSTLESARLEGRIAGFRIAVELEGVHWRYAGLALEAETVRVAVIPVEGAGEADAEAFRPADVTLPRLVLPTLEASLDIEQLIVTLGEGNEAVSGSLEHLRLAGETDAINLHADLEPNAVINEASRISLDWGARHFRLDWYTASQPETPSLRIEQTARNGPDRPVDGQVRADLDLAILDPRRVAPLANALGLPGPLAGTGRMSALVILEGSDQLAPVRADLSFEAARLTGGETTLQLDLEASIRKADRRPMVRITDLSLRSQGPLPRVNEALATIGDPLPMEGFDPGAPFTLSAAGPLDRTQPLELRLSAAGDALDALRASLRVDLELEDGTTLAATLPDLDWSREAPVPQLAATGLDLVLRRNSTLLYRLEAATVGFSAAEIHLRGDLVFADSTPGFEGRLDVAEFSDFSLSHTAATARLRTLGLSGPLGFGGETLRFEGALGGTGFVIAPVDEVAASSLLTADSLAFDLLAEGLETTALSGRGRFNGIALPDLGVTLDGVDLDLERLSLPAIDGAVSGLTTGLEVALDETRYRGLDLELRGQLREGRFLSGDGGLLLGFTGELPFRYEADLATPTLEARVVDAHLGAGALPDAARALALTLPESLSFQGGELVLDGRIAYADDALGGTLEVRGDALALGLGESRFDGLDFTTQVDIADVISGRGPLALKLANLAAGLDLTLLSTAIEFEGADLGLLSLDARLLGGELRTPGLRLVGGQLQGTLIEWTGFDLAQLLSFVDVDGLSGTGTLDATIPVVNDGGGPAVKAGRFAARGPGVLRYDSGVSATNIGLQALENFQYDELDGELNYANDGGYTIALSLLGRNPDLYGGHPIRFRLNLGGEMPALFRSLFITGDFDQAIIERLRAGQPALPETEP